MAALRLQRESVASAEPVILVTRIPNWYDTPAASTLFASEVVSSQSPTAFAWARMIHPLMGDHVVPPSVLKTMCVPVFIAPAASKEAEPTTAACSLPDEVYAALAQTTGSASGSSAPGASSVKRRTAWYAEPAF